METPKLTPEQTKIILFAALGIVFIFILAKAGKGLTESIKAFLTGKGADEAERDKTQKNLLKKEAEEAAKRSPLTRSASEYMSAADTIWKSLNRASIDDDPDAAQLAFTSIINSPADLAALKAAYGIRTLYNFGISVGDFDLIGTLSREFSNSRKKQTVDILRKKGVNLSL